jgi:hypothetical protein
LYKKPTDVGFLFLYILIMDLNNKDISYVIFSGNKWSQIMSYLYSKEYTIHEMRTVQSDFIGKAILTYSSISNSELEKDTLFILEHFEEDHAYIKFKDTTEIQRISKYNINPVSVSMYESNDDQLKYIIGEYSFSFNKMDKYMLLEKKEQITEGMCLEYFNDNKWNKTIVNDVDKEWNSMYSLLSKYNKLRKIV